MASERPIVASNLPAIREVLRDGENALLVTPGDPRRWSPGFAGSRTTRALGARLANTRREEVAAVHVGRRAGRLEALFAEVGG